MPSEQYGYYQSPWDSPIALALFVSLAAFCFLIWKRQTRIHERGVIALVGLLVACFGLIVADLVFRTGKPRVIVHREFMDCWGNAGRVPWHHFTNISRERGGMYNTGIVLRFNLSSQYIKDVDWGDWVRSRGWVNCTISGLTDNPKRVGFATSTDEIYQQVLSAWRSARWVWERPTYDEMIKLDLKPRNSW